MHPRSYYDKSGHPWTSEEDAQLEKEYTVDKLSITQIGDIHKRTPGGITWQLKRLKCLDTNTEARGYQEYRDSDLYKEIVASGKSNDSTSRGTTVDISSSVYARAGEPWSGEECERLLDEYKTQNLSLMKISAIHERNPAGVASQMKKLNIIQNITAIRGYTEYKQSAIYQVVQKARYERRAQRNAVAEPPAALKEPTQLSLIDRNEIRNLREEINDLKRNMAQLINLLEAAHEKGPKQPVIRHNQVNTQLSNSWVK